MMVCNESKVIQIKIEFKQNVGLDFRYSWRQMLVKGVGKQGSEPLMKNIYPSSTRAWQNSLLRISNSKNMQKIASVFFLILNQLLTISFEVQYSWMVRSTLHSSALMRRILIMDCDLLKICNLSDLQTAFGLQLTVKVV